MTAEHAMRLIAKEFTKASAAHGVFHSPHEGFAVILEEVDELKAEVWKRDTDHQAMAKEVVQVGAMALRFLVDLL